MAVAAKTRLDRAGSEKRTDPRVLRTRSLLEQAFIELLDEKGFQNITIQDIASRATVNRATFYAHFEDKFDLLDSYIRRQFNEELAEKVPLEPIYTLKQLQRVIVAVMEFLLPMHKNCSRPNREQMDPVFESAVQEELNKYLMDWFLMAPSSIVPPGLNQEVAARVWSWAIFGAALQWSQEARREPAAEIAREISIVLTAGTAPDED